LRTIRRSRSAAAKWEVQMERLLCCAQQGRGVTSADLRRSASSISDSLCSPIHARVLLFTRAMSESKNPNSLDSQAGQSTDFLQTHWSLVRRAGGIDSPESREALEALCRAYWFPIYAFVRRQGHSPHDAQDLTQDFFARLLASDSIARADPRQGK